MSLVFFLVWNGVILVFPGANVVFPLDPPTKIIVLNSCFLCPSKFVTSRKQFWDSCIFNLVTISSMFAIKIVLYLYPDVHCENFNFIIVKMSVYCLPKYPEIYIGKGNVLLVMPSQNLARMLPKCVA